MPKVSIVAPVYGVEKYIVQFLDSIRAQTLQDIEVILVDDGSPDNCPAILDAFAAEDNRYQVIHQKNGGVSAARNAGLASAAGEYVYIVDSDDWLVPDAAENLYNTAKKEDADIVYGDWILEKTNESKRVRCLPRNMTITDPQSIQALQCAVMTDSYSTNIRRPEFEYIRYFGGAPWRMLIRLSLIKENQLKYDPYVRGLGDDILFTLKLYEYVQKVSYIQQPIYHYRKVDVSYSHGYKANYLETVERIYERMEQFLRENKKSETLWGFYYFRVLLYLNQGLERYLKNAGNPKNEADRYKEYRELLKKEPYCSAIRKVPLHMITSRKRRYSFLLLRLRMYKIYWKIKLFG